MTDHKSRHLRQDPGHALLTRQHQDPCTGEDPCRGCQPCPRRHCSSCGIHLETTEVQTCEECRHKARRDLHAIVDLATLLPDQALSAAHEGHLAAAGDIPGMEALVMMSRGSEGLAEDGPDYQSPPSFVLGWWEEAWRERLNLDSLHPAWQRRPAATLVGAHRFLNEQLGWAASNHPGFHVFTRDLARLRSHLEEVLHAGDQPTEGVPCFHCGTTLERQYRDRRRCTHPTPARDQVRALISYQLRPTWTEIRAARTPCTICADQGGLDVANQSAGWHCPRCDHTYSVGEYDLALRTDADEVATKLPAIELADRLGVTPSTIWQWAHRGHVGRRGRGTDRRTLYDVAQATRHAQRENQDNAG